MSLSREEILGQLEKILGSRILHGSENLRSFLRYVVEKSLANKEAELREYVIATKVFGRDPSYDSRTDSVVRVQAGRLRSKLNEYYTTEGRADSVIIELPKGRYAPTFQRLTPPPEQPTPEIDSESEARSPLPPPSLAATVADERPLPPAPPPRDRNVWLKFIAVGLCLISLLLGLLAIEYRSQARQLKNNSLNSPPSIAAAELQTLSPIWGEFFKSSDPILVAFSNTVFQGRAETGMKLLNSLDNTSIRSQSQESPSYTLGDADSRFAAVISDHYTGVGEVMSVYFLSNLFSRANHPFRVKRSLLLTWDDVKAGNIVVLGSPAENFIIREIPQSQDFVFRVLNDDKDNPLYGIVNLKPRPGEESVYRAKEVGPSSYQLTEDYALVTLLKGLDEKRRLLIIAGIKTYGTQAATEYVTNPEFFKETLAELKKAAPGGDGALPNYFQVLLKVKVNGGVPVQTSYVTHHVLN